MVTDPPDPPNGGTAAPEDLHVVTDLGTLKAFSHPLRLRLHRALAVAGTATASQLAHQAGEAVSLVSYHLRKLADHGLIHEVSGRSSDSRERWWELVRGRAKAPDEEFGGAQERAAAHGAVTRLINRQRADMLERYADEQAAWGEEWRGAAFSVEFVPLLTPEETAGLGAELRAVVAKWQARARAAREAGGTEGTEGREAVAVHLNGFPFRP
ncbi:helix-turn-helix domain-containing protein [Streptomyces marincola]|uniref:helix-turn-helix domain-containing protein n=1 Tax=Streptomyces marincola TaxID=2878388 RepID=UPI001CF58E69|nr:helix-turn-helix domain-containing protein [Streptomyces marincola]UCM89443.1 helix-turn-helix domain-containing protein [Streptomyces marincola]